MREAIKIFSKHLFCKHYYEKYDYKVIDLPEYGRKCEISYLRCKKCEKEIQR